LDEVIRESARRFWDGKSGLNRAVRAVSHELTTSGSAAWSRRR
jgi:hypothetical protein